jgi:hypothetical protein
VGGCGIQKETTLGGWRIQKETTAKGIWRKLLK